MVIVGAVEVHVGGEDRGGDGRRGRTGFIHWVALESSARGAKNTEWTGITAVAAQAD